MAVLLPAVLVQNLLMNPVPSSEYPSIDHNPLQKVIPDAPELQEPVLRTLPNRQHPHPTTHDEPLDQINSMPLQTNSVVPLLMAQIDEKGRGRLERLLASLLPLILQKLLFLLIDHLADVRHTLSDNTLPKHHPLLSALTTKPQALLRVIPTPYSAVMWLLHQLPTPTQNHLQISTGPYNSPLVHLTPDPV